jgi:hypothetical protein
MKTKFLILMTVLLLSGCFSTANTLQPEEIITDIPTSTIKPTETATEIPTITPTFTPEPTYTPTAIPTPQIQASGPFEFPAGINPLTGLSVEDPELLNRRPVMVKVSNFPREGRPHAGLSDADIVFDYFIGVGTNRYVALYYGNDIQKVGPVRSGRYVDAQLVRMYEGILAYVGADENTSREINLALRERAISEAPATCPALCDEGATHTVTSIFADTALLTEYASEQRNIEQIRPELSGMAFDPAIPETGEIANSIRIKYNYYNYSEWRYDPESGKYLGWIEEVDKFDNVSLIPLIDRNTNEQLAFSNIVLVYAYYSEYAPTAHGITLWANEGGRKAVLFRDGMAITGFWKSAGTDNPMQFFEFSGRPLAFKPGNSWMSIVGTRSTLTETSENNWEMQFYLP